MIRHPQAVSRKLSPSLAVAYAGWCLRRLEPRQIAGDGRAYGAGPWQRDHGSQPWLVVLECEVAAVQMRPYGFAKCWQKSVAQNDTVTIDAPAGSVYAGPVEFVSDISGVIVTVEGAP